MGIVLSKSESAIKRSRLGHSEEIIGVFIIVVLVPALGTLLGCLAFHVLSLFHSLGHHL